MTKEVDQSETAQPTPPLAANRDGLAAVAMLVLTVTLIVVVVIAIL